MKKGLAEQTLLLLLMMLLLLLSKAGASTRPTITAISKAVVEGPRGISQMGIASAIFCTCADTTKKHSIWEAKFSGRTAAGSRIAETPVRKECYSMCRISGG